MSITKELEKSKQGTIEVSRKINSNSYRVRKIFSASIMTNTTFIIVLLALSGFGLSSCKTLYIPVDNFKKFFEGKDSAGLNNEKLTYNTYPIDSIYCIDRKGNTVLLENSPSLKIEIVYNNNEKSVVNFQSIRVDNNWIGPVEISKQGEYYNMLSPFHTTRHGDTLSTRDTNRAPSSYYVYANVPYENRTKSIPISEIKKIIVLFK